MHQDIRIQYKVWSAILIGIFIGVFFFGKPLKGEDQVDPPTYISDPAPKDYATGAKPLTFEQAQMHREMSEASAREGYTFNWDVTRAGTYSLGYKPGKPGLLPKFSFPKNEKLKSLRLQDFGIPLTPILNQRNCGSCVIFSFMANVMDLFKLRGVTLPALSTQHYMNCSSGGQCNGAYGEEIAADAKRLGKTGGFYHEADYPYIARTGRCQVKDGKPKAGIITDWRTIDGSAYSLLAAAHAGMPVSVGIAASGAFQSYSSGIYNACNSMSINHYVVSEGIDCGKAVDAEGNCKFDADGEIEGREESGAIAYGRNSWGTGFGEEGRWRQVLYSRSGKRCQGFAAFEGDAQVLVNGLPFNPSGPEPVTFALSEGGMTANVTYRPGAHFSREVLEAEVLKAMKALVKAAK